MLHISLVTLFPEFYTSPLACGLMARAREAGIVSFSFHNPREKSLDRHHHIDDVPYGGGVGMVLQVAPLAATLRDLPCPGRILSFSPAGRPFTQAMAEDLAKEEHITLLCGRYEGIDARIEELFPVEPIALSDAVFNSGDAAALCLIEAIARLQPGFMGKDRSADEESFAGDLLEYPQYTRPEIFEGARVPEILLSGHHAHIAKWRRERSLAVTRALRPDLLAKAHLTANDAAYLASAQTKQLGRGLSFCLVHHPVLIEGRVGTSSLTNLDVHDIARISASYGLGPFYVVTPLADQRELLGRILDHWCAGPAKETHPDRAYALSSVEPVATIAEAIAHTTARTGMRPTVVASSARWPRSEALVAADVRELLRTGSVLFCLGTAQGLADTALCQCDAILRPLRFLSYNHLSVRSAAAIYADRILGDFD